MAAALQTPVVAIFSAQSKPGEWFPYGKKNQVAYRKVECYGCNLNQCKYEVVKCMEDIGTEEVANLVSSILDPD
jgi:ADP-heptose:LPS heptosyltransferase